MDVAEDPACVSETIIAFPSELKIFRAHVVGKMKYVFTLVHFFRFEEIMHALLCNM
jgi:hypothetical protein